MKLRHVRWLRVVLAVVLGVVTSVGVAWGVFWGNKPSAAWVEAVWMESASRGVTISTRREIGRRAVELDRVYALPSPSDSRSNRMWTEIEFSQARKMAPEIVDVGPEVIGISVASAGFPMLCVEGRLTWGLPMTRSPSEHGVLRFGRRGWVRWPALPLWGGLAVNTAFYGAAWYPLLGVPGMVMARMRKRRGMCRGCGYDMRGLAVATCPECGKG